jgi:predicted transcriptional regulator
MSDDNSVQGENSKSVHPEGHVLAVGNTKRDSPLSFRLPPDIKAKLLEIADSMKFDNRSLALKHIIDNYHLVHEERMRAVNRIRQDMARYGIKADEL